MAKKKVNWAACKAEVDAMRAKLHREVQAPDIVNVAKNPKSAFYSLIEHDDKKASYLYRLWQAREALARLVVLYPNHKGKEVPAREFLWVPHDVGSGKNKKFGSYASRNRVENNKGLLIQVVEIAAREQQTLAEKYSTIPVLHGAIPLMEAAVAKIKAVLAKLKKKAN